MSILKNFVYEEDGMGTIEIAIIVAALVALAIVFKKQLANLWKSAATAMTSKSSAISSDEFATVTEPTS
jgi:Flp pilus assembly pilin Flp